MISYLQVISVIKSFADQHLQVNNFGYEFREQMPNLASLNEAYALLYVVPIGATTLQNVNEFDVDIYCVDRLQKDRSNVNSVVSDCNGILNDLILWLEEGQNLIEITSTGTQTPINNDLLDYVGGWVLRLRLQVEKIGLCEIPLLNGAPVPQGYVQIVNSNATFTQNIPNSTNYTLPNTAFTAVDENDNSLGSFNVPSVVGGQIVINVPSSIFDLTINVDGVFQQTLQLDAGANNIINVNS